MPWLFLLVLHFTGRTDALPLTDRTGPPAVSSTSIAVDAPLDTVGAALASLKERAARLASQMSLEEKISQLSTNSPAIPHLNISEFDWWQGEVEISALYPLEKPHTWGSSPLSALSLLCFPILYARVNSTS